MATDNTTGTVTKSDSVTAPDAVATKLPQSVEIRDIGPCKKHVKVVVDRAAIDARFDEKFTDLVRSDQSFVSGFRPGKAPRKIIERRYKKEVAAEVKTEVLMASLEQLAEEQAISPLSPPELDPNTIGIPESGPFIYEFDIEVRPEFDLPSYKGLKLRRPTHTYTDAEVAEEAKRFLEPFGQIVPKDDQTVALDDLITADVVIQRDGKELNKLEEVRVKVEERLALSDGVAENFGQVMVGAKPGETRTVDITLSQEIANPALRGTTVQAVFTVKEVKTVKLPELTPEVLGYFGVRTPEQFNELIRVRLERQLEYTQRQSARKQVLQLLAGDAKWDLPQDLLRRQARKTLARRVMEMRSAGMTDEQIAGRQRMLELDSLRSTAAALKEHFVLQKIAEIEKLEIEDADIEAEIEAIAERAGESYRKVRARMEKEDLIEALATELLERKALDLVLASAEYEDYELSPTEDQEGEVATVAAQALPEEEAAGTEVKPSDGQGAAG
jgi:trigger factor